jgi:outer membrane receptor protein involved in Fe transport
VDAARGVTLRLDGRYVGRAYLDNTERRAFTTPPYLALDAQATLRAGRSSLLIQLNNLTDRRIYTGGQTDGVRPYFFIQASRHLVVTARLAAL